MCIGGGNKNMKFTLKSIKNSGKKLKTLIVQKYTLLLIMGKMVSIKAKSVLHQHLVAILKILRYGILSLIVIITTLVILGLGITIPNVFLQQNPTTIYFSWEVSNGLMITIIVLFSILVLLYVASRKQLKKQLKNNKTKEVHDFVKF